EAFAVMKETEENAARGRRAILFDQSQLAPGVGRRGYDRRRFAIRRQFGTRPAGDRKLAAFWRTEQRGAMPVHITGDFDLREIKAGEELVAAGIEVFEPS